MSFIATEPTATPEAPENAAIVTNDGFFPDIDLDKLRASMRLDGTVTYDRLRDATIAAIISINAELKSLKALHQGAGVEKLADVPSDAIGGESTYLQLYRGAVYRTTKADLTERYRDFDATKSGSDDADQLDDTIGDHRRAARWFVRDLLGVPHTTVELI